MLMEDVLVWFQQLNICSRCELMVYFLRMLNPYEIRFVGVCLEDLANAHAQQLKEQEKQANNIQLVTGALDLCDPIHRAYLITWMCLLARSNEASAGAIFSLLVSSAPPLDPSSQSDLTVLLTLAGLHPSFSFSQKRKLRDKLESVSSHPVGQQSPSPPQLILNNHQPVNDQVPSAAAESSQVDVATVDSQDAGTSGEVCPRCRRKHAEEEESWPDSNLTSIRSDNITPTFYVTGIEVISETTTDSDQSLDEEPVGKQQVPLKVTWSDTAATVVNRSYDDFYNFHRRMLDLFPKEAGCHGHRRLIPYLPTFDREEKSIEIDETGSSLELSSGGRNREMVAKYIDDLMVMPARLRGSQPAWEFFGRKWKTPETTVVQSASSDMHLARLFGGLESPRDNQSHTQSTATATTDEDRDLCVRNGIVKPFTFHNSSVSSEPYTSKASVGSNSDTRVHRDQGNWHNRSGPRSYGHGQAYDRRYQYPKDWVPGRVWFLLRQYGLTAYKSKFSRFSIEELVKKDCQSLLRDIEAAPEHADTIAKMLAELKRNSGINGMYQHRTPIMTQSQTSANDDTVTDDQGDNGPPSPLLPVVSVAPSRPRSTSSASAKPPLPLPSRSRLSGSADNVTRHRSSLTASQSGEGWLQSEVEFPSFPHHPVTSQSVSPSVTDEGTDSAPGAPGPQTVGFPAGQLMPLWPPVPFSMTSPDAFSAGFRPTMLAAPPPMPYYANPANPMIQQAMRLMAVGGVTPGKQLQFVQPVVHQEARRQQRRMQGGGVLSCCNCGEEHAFEACPHESLSNVTKSGEFRLQLDNDS